MPPRGTARGQMRSIGGSGRVVGDGSAMLTPENIVVLRACACSASKLLIFAISRRKTILNCFSRSPTDFAQLSHCERVNVSYNIVDWRSTREPTKKAGRLTCFSLAPPAGLERSFVMLTPENIVVLRASTLRLDSASKLLIFAISRRKTILNCFSRSPTDFAQLNRCERVNVSYNIVDRSRAK